MPESYKLERDLREAVAMAQALEDYIRQDELYGHVGGGMFGSGSMPKLTVGALLLRLRRLQALRDTFTPDQREQLDAALVAHRQVQREWAVHYEAKLIKEALSRLGAMNQFIEECRDNLRLCASAYRPEALRRTIVQEITREMERLNIASEAVETKIRSTDARFRALLRPADFLWDDTLRPLYDQQEFWWLYQSPPDAD